MTVITIPNSIYKILIEKARENEMTVEEYLIEIITQNLDPTIKAEKYIECALNLLEQARMELDKGDVRQASEKIWGAVALAVKSYALEREGKKLTSHRELWKYKDVIARDIGEWIRDSWMHAASMHVNFYEGWATRRDVEIALNKTEKLVSAIAERLSKFKLGAHKH